MMNLIRGLKLNIQIFHFEIQKKNFVFYPKKHNLSLIYQEALFAKELLFCLDSQLTFAHYHSKESVCFNNFSG